MLNGVSEAAWSPDGQWIAFTAMVSPTDDDEVLTGRKPLDEAEKKKRDEEERIRLDDLVPPRWAWPLREIQPAFCHACSR
jgi:dipeptidyl aminopeptidase/acylaminoacyl peptidase